MYFRLMCCPRIHYSDKTTEHTERFPHKNYPSEWVTGLLLFLGSMRAPVVLHALLGINYQRLATYGGVTNRCTSIRLAGDLSGPDYRGGRLVPGPPVQLFQPFSQFIAAGLANLTMLAVLTVHSQEGQQLADPTSHRNTSVLDFPLLCGIRNCQK